MAAQVLLMLRQNQQLSPETLSSNLQNIDKAEILIQRLAPTDKTAKRCGLFLHQLRYALTQIGMWPIKSYLYEIRENICVSYYCTRQILSLVG